MVEVNQLVKHYDQLLLVSSHLHHSAGSRNQVDLWRYLAQMENATIQVCRYAHLICNTILVEVGGSFSKVVTSGNKYCYGAGQMF